MAWDGALFRRCHSLLSFPIRESSDSDLCHVRRCVAFLFPTNLFSKRKLSNEFLLMVDQKAATVESRPPLPPFTRATAIQKVRLAEDAWNSRDPEKVALAYTPDSRWRNRAEFPTGRQEIIAFLKRKWTRELDYRLIKELWTFEGNRIAVRFAYESHDDSGNWFRSYGNENWEFDDNGLMRLRYACINDLPIKESERKYHWPLGRRPDDHPGLSNLGL
jgi:nuclear transport factor 2 (NTF2) superfamily protein